MILNSHVFESANLEINRVRLVEPLPNADAPGNEMDLGLSAKNLVLRTEREL